MELCFWFSDLRAWSWNSQSLGLSSLWLEDLSLDINSAYMSSQNYGAWTLT